MARNTPIATSGHLTRRSISAAASGPAGVAPPRGSPAGWPGRPPGFPAERGYRAVLYFGDHCPEAHLGLGVTLALEAQLERDLLRARALQLQAAAQFAAVSERDAPYLAALYDRAVMLERVGRRDEARRWARAYLALDPASGWAEKLKRALALEAMASAAAGAPRGAYRGEPPASGP